MKARLAYSLDMRPRPLVFLSFLLALASISPALAQLRQIDGQLLARFAPDSLAGAPLSNPMTGSTAGASRMIQPGGVEAVYALGGGVFANLSFGNNYTGTTPYIIESCTTWERFGEHRACLSSSPDRATLRWLFSARVMVTLSAPDRATVVRLGRALDVEGIATFVEANPGTPI